MNLSKDSIQNLVQDKFLRYVKIWTTSEPELASAKTPSTPGQWDLLKLLVQELNDLGVSDVTLSDLGYLIGRIPARGKENTPYLGFMAHVDTASDAPGKDVKPRIHTNWQGDVIQLENSVTLDPESISDMKDFVGETLISSDGTTLLGADDKAGVAEIMTAVEILMKSPEILHGPLEIIFTPDEETGCGMDKFPVKELKSRFCFTLDGGREGELELECYNAWRVDLEFQGSVIHPGYARGKLVNAITMATQFVSLLPRSESPEATDGRYGNYWPNSIEGTLDKAKVSVMIRDFEADGAQRRLEAVRQFAGAVEASFPGGKVTLVEKQQYKNMKQELDKYPELEPLMLKAYEKADVVPLLKPIRGGTDGSKLTAMGVPTPNIFAGGFNFHSVREWVPLKSMEKAVNVVLALVETWSED
ncbi:MULTISPECIES: peptidase T [unclassified Oceanispirochaeta]|uniref:peptidase T n=1 Tax=unclassified Oceanispirochaeta TaxID=2635722 RepID=UPI000E09C24A|nr:MULTISPECIES: peptidase T [unclassified Oceanispirochaeta]MBF9018515.1 peptidase T [Oceanispirochaeta sp. M2]NPD74922.1 peptidase T [Oceanispirochaeta sp. M1]RDG29253.1 peptidase T [Oceanispirochaeta sp. M1]